MFKRLVFISGLVGLLVFAAQQPAAQSQDNLACEGIVTEALQVLGTACTEVGRNEACYGHNQVTATFRAGVEDVAFATSGDTTALIDVEALVTQPLDADAGTWGVALMRLQADLPEADSTAAMTLILFGDTEVINAVDSTLADFPTCSVLNPTNNNMNVRSGPGLNRPIVSIFPSGAEGQAVGRSVDNAWIRLIHNGRLGWVSAPNMRLDCAIETLYSADEDDQLSALYTQPMQAFTLQNGGDSFCDAAPNGLLVESPEGHRAHVMVNGVEMEFASAGFLTVESDGALLVAGLAGEIRIRSAGETVILPPGLQSRIPLLDATLNQRGRPAAPLPIAVNPLDAMPRGVMREYLDRVLQLDVETLINIPILPQPIFASTPRPEFTIPTIGPRIEPRPEGTTPLPTVPSIPPRPQGCSIGDTVPVTYSAVNLSNTSQAFTLRLTDGTRYVSQGLRITVDAGATVTNTVSLTITEPVPATVTVVSVVVLFDDPTATGTNPVVAAVGALSCIGG